MTVGVMGATLTLKPSWRRWWWIGAGSLAFTAIGVWMVTRGDGRGWFVAGLFGLGVVMCAAMFWTGSAYLKLLPDRFVVCVFWRRHHYHWDGVGPFRAIELPHGNLVGFDLAEDAKRPKGAWVAVAVSGAEAALPDGYGLTVDELTALMNEWRERALSGQSPD